VLKDISISVKKGELVGICGAVGSGKSSLASASWFHDEHMIFLTVVVLNQMKVVQGSVATSGFFAYVAQQVAMYLVRVIITLATVLDSIGLNQREHLVWKRI
jgi:ABC-type dipeptide/oligopeptide/nickel transport system ATPase subunit